MSVDGNGTINLGACPEWQAMLAMKRRKGLQPRLQPKTSSVQRSTSRCYVTSMKTCWQTHRYYIGIITIIMIYYNETKAKTLLFYIILKVTNKEQSNLWFWLGTIKRWKQWLHDQNNFDLITINLNTLIIHNNTQ